MKRHRALCFSSSHATTTFWWKKVNKFVESECSLSRKKDTNVRHKRDYSRSPSHDLLPSKPISVVACQGIDEIWFSTKKKKKNVKHFLLSLATQASSVSKRATNWAEKSCLVSHKLQKCWPKRPRRPEGKVAILFHYSAQQSYCKKKNSRRLSNLPASADGHTQENS